MLDNYVSCTLASYAEAEGFEPPVVLPTLVFKTSAINRTRPHFHGVGTGGIEPPTFALSEQRSKPLSYAPMLLSYLTCSPLGNQLLD
jgi:hypothetical protein